MQRAKSRCKIFVNTCFRKRKYSDQDWKNKPCLFNGMYGSITTCRYPLVAAKIQGELSNWVALATFSTKQKSCLTQQTQTNSTNSNKPLSFCFCFLSFAASPSLHLLLSRNLAFPSLQLTCHLYSFVMHQITHNAAKHWSFVSCTSF